METYLVEKHECDGRPHGVSKVVHDARVVIC